MKIVIAASCGSSLISFRGNLIKEWVKRGHEVICISIEPSGEMENDIGKLGAAYYQIAGDRTGTSIFSGFRMIKNYRKAFRAINPDICFLYMSKPIAFGGIAAVRSGIKHINVLISGLENAYYRTGIKDRIVRIVMSCSYKYVSSHSDNVFIQNSDDYKFFIEKKLSSPANSYVVNGSGVDMSHYIKEKMPEQPVILMVARLLWSKGIREFLDAVKIIKDKHPETKVMLVGGLDDNDEALSEAQLNECIMKYDIEYCGFSSDVREYLKKCSIFVLPSYHEGTPRSVLEAMSTGRPIITTDAPGCRETVKEGENGFLVPVGDSTALSDKMQLLIEDATLREKMAERSYQICLEKYDVNKVNTYINKKMFEKVSKNESL